MGHRTRPRPKSAKLGASAIICRLQTQYMHCYMRNTDITRNSSEDEIANVNFLYDDIVQALQNAIDSCINSARDRCGYVGTQFYESQ